MAKSREISKRSRAARRATSPSIDTDKSLKNVARETTASERPAVLSVQYAAGVSKNRISKRKSQISAKARKRQQRSMDMGEAVMERTSKKIEKSKGRSRVVQDRAKRWEDVNRMAAMTSILEVEGQDDMDEDGAEKPDAGKDWETDDDKDATAAATAAPAPVDDDLDEIL
ncbi:hypothetical protein VHEMI03327 [[Torrubiella] hemipterigena]|uniref:Ribosome biogenesis protein Alb1 n=1 Tax=[Torrubiella] hemipterigena TaxID=1531966 RepID=A0A0A1SY65_9HYPO|nr:hypothetical protein VHEMI03327 [[Torrubiella] hemipterigena]